MVNNKELLGKRIKELRKSEKLTQEKLAELIGLETTSLSGIESGRHFPSMITLEKIASILKIELKALFDFQNLVSESLMKEKIINNIDKIGSEQLKFIYKFVENYK